MNRCAIIPLVISLFLLLNCSSPSPPINVVLISVDTLRPDHLRCYGYQRDTSPNIDRIAGKGTLFSEVVSTTTWTLPAHIALLTSMYDSVHGVTSDRITLGDNRTTLADILRSHGYTTAAFVSGPYLNRHFGFSKGFDQYHDFTDAQIPVELMLEHEIISEEILKEFIQGKQKASTAAHRSITSPKATEAVTKWLDTAKRPFFLFVHYFDVHYDFIPPGKYGSLFDPNYQGQITADNFIKNRNIRPGMAEEDLNHIISLYDGEIAFTDYHIGILLDALEELGLTNNTLIVLTSDHGEEFFEHGAKGHNKNLYEETLRIPLLLSLPGRIHEGREISNMVRIIDVAPTVLDLLGLPVHPEMMGRSLASILLGSEPDTGPPAFCELHMPRINKHLYGLRGEDWKVIYERKSGLWEFYRLDSDEGEKESARLPVPHQFRERLLNDIEMYEQMGEGLAQEEERLYTDPPSTLLEKLKDLGYVQ